MTLEISEIVLAKSFLVLGLLAFACIGFASLVNQNQKGAAVRWNYALLFNKAIHAENN